ENKFPQEMVKDFVTNVFEHDKETMDKYMPVYDHAAVHNRQLAVDKDWLLQAHTFAEQNNKYQKNAVTYSLQAIDHALTNQTYLIKNIPYDALDMIIFVSSTGISTPSICTHLMNERSFREDISRMPLWGLGCAGGAIGLSRGCDWLKAIPANTALIAC